MSVPIIDRIRTADNLPSLSTVAMEILALCRDEDASTTSIGEIVQQDAALTAKLLKTVNSPFFGMPREVASPHQAITLLGVRTVKQLALSFSLVDTIGTDQKCDFDYQGYWRRSLTSAAAARLLGMALDPTMAEEAFAGGLLSELGMVRPGGARRSCTNRSSISLSPRRSHCTRSSWRSSASPTQP